VGWVLARMIDLDVPLEVAQYAEGQRFVAFFVLNQVEDPGKEGSDKKVSQYLCVITDPHDGLPYDFDQIRVFTWNVRKHRYETAYRRAWPERPCCGHRDQREFRQGRRASVFILRVKDDSGNISERKYKMNSRLCAECWRRASRKENAQTGGETSAG